MADERLVTVVRVLGLGLHVALSGVQLLSHLLLLLLVDLFLGELLVELVLRSAASFLGDLLLVAASLAWPLRVLALAQALAPLALSEASLASFALL